MSRTRVRRSAAPADHRAAARWIAAGIALLIAWGSLYPLVFVAPNADVLRERLAQIGVHVFSRTDLIANFLLYLPFGAACRFALGGVASARRTMLASLIGSALSLALELAQLATPHRATSVVDWSLNTVGAAVGSAAVAFYLRIGRRRRFPGLRHARPALVPTCLLAIWFIGEFAPYLPVRRPVPLAHLVEAFVHRHAFAGARLVVALAHWWIIAECLRQIWRRGWAIAMLAALIALTVLEQAYLGTDRRSVEEWLAFAIVAALALLCLRWPMRIRAWGTVAACLAVLVTTTVWPVPPPTRIGVFHWVPFSGTLLASRDYRPLLDALFVEGALLWSLDMALGRAAAAFAITLAASVAVELAHLWTPPHRAEVTNPLLVVALLVAFAAARRYQSYAYGGDGDATARAQER